jgi:hypothetical protein
MRESSQSFLEGKLEEKNNMKINFELKRKDQIKLK